MQAAKATRCASPAALLAAVMLSAAPVASGAGLPLSWSLRAQHQLAVNARSLPFQAGVAGAAVKKRSTTHSCAADRRSTGPFRWQLLPVACEQPPRSNLGLQLHWASVAALFG